MHDNLQEYPQSDAQKNKYKLTLQSSLTSYFSDKHFNRTGFYINNLGYDLDIDHTETVESSPKNIVNGKGQSLLLQIYSQSRFNLTSKLTLNAGFHSQYFQLNRDIPLNPGYPLNTN